MDGQTEDRRTDRQRGNHSGMHRHADLERPRMSSAGSLQIYESLPQVSRAEETCTRVMREMLSPDMALGLNQDHTLRNHIGSHAQWKSLRRPQPAWCGETGLAGKVPLLDTAGPQQIMNTGC